VKRALLAIFILGAVASHAELNFQEVILDSGYIAYERDVGDVTGDGLNDVVAVQEGDTSIQVFTAPDWTRSTLIDIPSGTYRYPRADDFKVADVDGDLDTDVIVRLGSGPSDDGVGIAVWYENPDSGPWTQHLIGNSLEYVKDIVVADFDRDLRPDVAMRMDSRTQIWLQEPGGTWTEVLINHDPHEGMEAADVDMDGDPDLVLNGFWYATPNTPADCRVAGNYAYGVIDSAWFTQSGDWTANSCKVSVGDIDGDGTNDVVLSQSERAGYQVTWYKGAGSSWVGTPVAQIDYCHNLQAYDADLDGDVDLLAGGMTQSQHKGLRLFLNQGGGSGWDTFIIQSDGSYSAELGDIDNDGDLDIVGIRNWNATPSYIYRSNAGGPPSFDFWKYIEVSDQHVRTFGLTFADVDGDNDLDIASGPYVYRNPGSPMEAAWSRTTLPGSGHAFMAVDVDGDVFVDLLVQQATVSPNPIELYWIEASDTGATAWNTPVLVGDVPRSDHEQGFQGSKLAQIEAGGRPEVVISSYQGIYYFTIPAANPEGGNWPRIFVAANDSDEGIGAADVDADNDVDISFTTGGTKAVKWAENPGNGSGNWTVHTIGSFPEADWPDRCEIADLNGDSRPDIIATEENQSGSPDALACWWEQPAAGPTNANWTRRTIVTQYTMNNLDQNDFDQDGDVDLVLAEHQGTEKIQIWENDGAGNFTDHLVGQGHESHLGGRTVDLDGDGDLDLVSIAYNDFSYLHLWRNDSPLGTPRAAKPVFAPTGGVFDEPLDVALSCSTAGAEIRVTSDGSDPSDTSDLYSAPIPVTTSVVLKARAFKAGYDPSLIASASFIGPKVQTPVIAPPGGTFSDSVSVTLSCATTGVTLRFASNGLDPSDSSEVYSAPLSITNTTTLKARAFRDGLMASDVVEADFTKFFLGAIAHWRLDERFGSVAMDSSGGGHHGTVNGAAWTSGHYDHALTFDGNNDRVGIPAFDVSGSEITIMGWFRLDSGYVNNDARILSKAVGHAEADHYWMLSLTESAGNLRLRFRLKTDGATSTLIASSGDITLNTWYHAAASYDGAMMRLFLNGGEVGSLGKTGDLTAGAVVEIMIGANPPDVYAPFHGLIDDARIYNVALDGSDVVAAMNESPAPHVPVVGSIQPGEGWTVQSSAEAGHYLMLERSTDLTLPAWEILSTNSATSSSVPLTDTNDLPQAVYRVQMD